MADSLLRRALVEQESELRDLNQKLSELRAVQEKRDAVHALVSQMRFKLGLPPLGTQDERTEVDGVFDAINESPEDQPLWKVARGILERAQQPLTIQAIVSAINSMPSHNLTGRSGLETVRAAVNRKPDVFEKVGRKYALTPKGRTIRLF